MEEPIEDLALHISEASFQQTEEKNEGLKKYK